MEIGKRFGCDDRNVLTQENARDRERAFAQGLGRSLVVTLLLMMGSMIVVAGMGRVGLRRRHACAENNRQAGRIGREHEARRHEHAREQQRQQPQSPAMEMHTLHAGTKYTSLRRPNPWLLWAMVAKKSGLSPERGHHETGAREGMFPTEPHSRDLSLITQLRDLHHIWRLAASVDSMA